MNFMFWNTNNKDIARITEAATEQYDIDHLFLAEVESEENLEAQVNILESRGFSYINTPGCERIRCFSKLTQNDFRLHQQHSHFSIISFQEYIVAAVHFPSQLHTSMEQLGRFAETVSDAIFEAENLLGHQNSIALGDFNMNPFEPSMVSFLGMCAVNHSVIPKTTLTRDSETRRIFYNPTWMLYGKYHQFPGTFKYPRLGTDVIRWHFLDQVVIRPCLVEQFDFGKFEIVSKFRDINLTNDSSAPNVSDHLPITFTLNKQGVQND